MRIPKSTFFGFSVHLKIENHFNFEGMWDGKCFRSHIKERVTEIIIPKISASQVLLEGS